MEPDSDPLASNLCSFDWRDDTEVASAVTMAVSDVSGDDPLAMEPLASVIDPDAVADLFAPTRNRTERVDGSVEFEYHGYRVVIDADGRGYIFDSHDSVPPESTIRGGASGRADD